MRSNEINVKSKDGACVFATTCNMESEARGVVIICHGFGEHSGSYEELAARLKRANYASVVFDQRGHGKFPGHPPGRIEKLRGVIPGYQSFMDDIDAVMAAVRERMPNTPIALYGHSMGGNIAVNYLLRHGQSDFFCAVLEAPWLGLNERISPPPAGLIRVLSSLLPNMPLPEKLTRLPLHNITSDEKKQKEIGNDPLYHNRMTLRMFSGINDSCEYALKNASALSIPTFVAFAREEKIVSNTAIQKFTKNLTAEGYDSHHSIHNDRSREAFYRDLINFLNKHCAV